MKRIMAIDFGLKRVGMAVTDTLQISAHGLETVSFDEIRPFLTEYLEREDVETIVVGDPFIDGVYDKKLSGEISAFIQWLEDTFPRVQIARQDESFSSVMAKDTILRSGAKQKRRRDKALVDKVSAILILQQFLGHV